MAGAIYSTVQMLGGALCSAIFVGIFESVLALLSLCFLLQWIVKSAGLGK